MDTLRAVHMNLSALVYKHSMFQLLYVSSHWFVFTTRKNKTVFPILLVSSSESDDSFPKQFSFTDSFEIRGSYMYGFSFVKSDKYSLTEV